MRVISKKYSFSLRSPEYKGFQLISFEVLPNIHELQLEPILDFISVRVLEGVLWELGSSHQFARLIVPCILLDPLGDHSTCVLVDLL
jgi:hypothetical protein